MAIFIHSSKLASSGMTRFPGVTAVPVISGMPSGSWEGVWGLCCPAAMEIRRLAGVAVDARIELRWAFCCAWRRIAFSCRSSLSGTLRWLATRWRGHVRRRKSYFIGVFCGEAAVVYLVVRAMMVDIYAMLTMSSRALFVVWTPGIAPPHATHLICYPLVGCATLSLDNGGH